MIGVGGGDPGQMATGLLLAVCGSVLAGFAAFGLAWGADLSLSGELQDGVRGLGRSLELCCVAVVFLISSMGSAVISGTAGLVFGESVDLRSLGVAFLGVILQLIQLRA